MSDHDALEQVIKIAWRTQREGAVAAAAERA
jgi:hypothetical protein